MVLNLWTIWNGPYEMGHMICHIWKSHLGNSYNSSESKYLQCRSKIRRCSLKNFSNRFHCWVFTNCSFGRGQHQIIRQNCYQINDIQPVFDKSKLLITRNKPQNQFQSEPSIEQTLQREQNQINLILRSY